MDFGTIGYFSLIQFHGIGIHLRLNVLKVYPSLIVVPGTWYFVEASETVIHCPRKWANSFKMVLVFVGIYAR